MDDLIARAQAKREWHLAQAAKLETFLATYYDLEQELKAKPPADVQTDAEKVVAPNRQRNATRPQAGIGADTIKAAEELVLAYGPMSTRDMLPMILARGIDVGGKDPLATLSARLSGRGDLVVINGKWQFIQKEAADNPGKESSTASLFQTNQGGRDGPALAS